MSSSQVVGTVILALIIVSTVGSMAASVPAVCEPGFLESMPPHIRKVCVALENSNKLSNALNAYIQNEASALVYKADDLIGQPDKRTDADHVFLRFGRRR
ncbi:dromyosuppressin [Hermetia illucens]|nr:dromyosuppressin [Hermetia illucens]